MFISFMLTFSRVQDIYLPNTRGRFLGISVSWSSRENSRLYYVLQENSTADGFHDSHVYMIKSFLGNCEAHQ